MLYYKQYKAGNRIPVLYTGGKKMGIIGGCMVPHPPCIIPEVGRGEEKVISETVKAYREVGRRIAALKPETVVVVSPHSVMYRDYIHISPGESARGDFGNFGAAEIKIQARYDADLVSAVSGEAQKEKIPAGTEGDSHASPELDHATMIPLYFLNGFDAAYELVRIGIAGLPFSVHYELGKVVAKEAKKQNRRVFFIASGDLSHYLKKDGPYGFRKEGPEYDREIMDIMGKGDFDRLLSLDESFCERAGECGQRGFCMLAGAMADLDYKAEKLSYEGPFGVGYGVCFYTVSTPAVKV